MTTDDTARAIVTCPGVETFSAEPFESPDGFADLQRMARLWLLKSDIEAELRWYATDLDKRDPSEGKQSLIELQNKLASLESE